MCSIRANTFAASQFRFHTVPYPTEVHVSGAVKPCTWVWVGRARRITRGCPGIGIQLQRRSTPGYWVASVGFAFFLRLWVEDVDFSHQRTNHRNGPPTGSQAPAVQASERI
jgi:hypothetical protein